MADRQQLRQLKIQTAAQLAVAVSAVGTMSANLASYIANNVRILNPFTTFFRERELTFRQQESSKKIAECQQKKRQLEADVKRLQNKLADQDPQLS